MITPEKDIRLFCDAVFDMFDSDSTDDDREDEEVEKVDTGLAITKKRD